MKLVITVVAALVGLSTADALVPWAKLKLKERQNCACYCGDGELFQPSVADCEGYGGCDGCCSYIVSAPLFLPIYQPGVLILLAYLVCKWRSSPGQY